MIDFHPVTMEDRQRLHPILFQSGRRGCDYGFSTLFLWNGYTGERVAEVDGFVCVELHQGAVLQYGFPAGEGNIAAVLRKLRHHARAQGQPLRLTWVLEEDKPILEEVFPGQLHYCSQRDSWDYLYPIEQLAELRGKKMQAKRNHCNRFAGEYGQFRILPYSELLRPQIEAMLEQWYRDHAPNETLQKERRVLTLALDNFESLQMDGLVLYGEDTPLAFSMGSRIGEDVYDVNFEKALNLSDGAYAMINREFSRFVREKYPQVRWLNREDDMGLEGLRRAKESYNPILLEKSIAEVADGNGV